MSKPKGNIANLKPFTKGDPRINRTIPGPGRPPMAFKNFLAQLREDPRVQQAIENAATDEESKNFKAALDVLVRYDIEKPAEAFDVNLTDEQREAKVVDILTAAKKRKERQSA